jgi:hypothetical protein
LLPFAPRTDKKPGENRDGENHSGPDYPCA